jgi:hypothetical protein
VSTKSLLLRKRNTAMAPGAGAVAIALEVNERDARDRAADV